MAAEQILPAEDVVQGPVGVLPVELRVRADGFRLEPEAELQSHGVQLFAEAAQAARQFLFVHGIVAKAGGIAVALAEPAVVEDEQLAAELLCRPAEAQELRFRKIEHAALPAVVDDGAGPALPVRRDEVFVHIPVEAGGQAAEARAGIRHDGLRRLKARAGRKFPVEICGRDALQHAGEALQALLRAEIVAAGVEQVEAVDRARLLPRVRRGEQEAGVGAAGGGAGRTLEAGPCQGDGRAGVLHLGDPAAGEGMQLPVAGKLRAGAHAFADVHGGAAAVFEDRPPGKDRGQDAVEERQAELRRRVFQVHGKDGLAAGDGQRRGRRLLQHLAAEIAEVGGDGSAADRQLQRAFAVVAAAAAAPLERQDIEAVGVGALAVERAVAPAAAGAGGEGRRVGSLGARAEVQVLQKPVLHAEEIGRFFILQVEHALSDVNHSMR